MRKLLVALIALIVVGGIGYFLIPIDSPKNSFGHSEALNAIPKKSTFVIRCDNPVKKWALFNSSTIGSVLNQSGVQSKINSLFDKIDSVQNDQMANFFKAKVFIAGVLTAGNQLNYIVSLNANGYSKEQIFKYIKDVIGNDPVSNKEYELNKIFTFQIDGKDIYFSQKDAVVLFSSSPILIEEGIRELTSEKHLADNSGFKKLLKTADLASDGNFFVNYKELGGYLNLFSNKKRNFQKSLGSFGEWAEVDLNARDKSLMFNGFSFISDSIYGYINAFSGETPQSLSFSSVLPENTGVLTYMSYSSFESYKKKYDSFLDQKQILYKHQKNILNINKKYSFTIESDFYGWIGEEMGVFTINGDENSFDKNSGAIIKVSDLNNAKKGLKELHAGTGVDDPIDYQTLKINDLGLTNFLPLTLGDEFDIVSGTKYVLIEDYIVFANDESALKHIINFYLRGKTLVKNIQFNKFYEQFSSESNFFYYCNVGLANNYFGNYLNEKSLNQYKFNLDSLKKIQALGVQINANKNLFYTNAFVNYNSNEETQNVSLIEVKLDTTYSIKPWVVKNHYTKELELLIQDDLHNLYLINNVGKILWKKQLSEKIIGNVGQVDRYKNDKFQYVFVTKNKFHQIDRKGRDVSGFPVPLKASNTQGLVVLDYDLNRNYRLLVTQGKNINNFSIDGKVIKGWSFKATNSDIAVEPELIQISGKDYIVTSDESGNVRVLNRKGEDRIELVNRLPSGSTNHFVWNNEALSNSGVLSTDSNGTIHFVKLADELETFAIKAFDPGFKLNYQDFNGDGVIDFVANEDQKIQVYKNNKKRLLSIPDIEYVPAYGVQSFNLGGNKAINILTDKNEMEIYGYNETGELLNGFPIEGCSPSLVVDLDNNKSNDLIIGDKLGSVYIYSLGK